MGFLDTFKRWKLAKDGMGSSRRRRTDSNNELASRLESSRLLRWLLYLLSGLALLFLVGSSGTMLSLTGDSIRSLTAVVAVFATALMMFNVNHPTTAAHNSRVFLIFGGIFLHLLVLRGINVLVLQLNQPPILAYLGVPYALAPMIHSVLLGRNHGIFSAIFVSLFGCLMISSDEVLQYIVISLVAGFVAVYLTRSVRSRSSLLRAGAFVGIVCLALAYAFGLIAADFSQPRWWNQVILLSAATFGIQVLTAMVISGLLPLLEGPFGLTTPITWLELSDLNHKLLRRVQLETPGTFHHSLVVASLAESAAEEIGANALMCRVCSYYHDIGKLTKPSYFIENQGDGQANPHDRLTPTMSALIITAHVKDGVDLALKHKLNRRIIEVIKEHHGDSMVAYFYHKAITQREEFKKRVEAGEENPDDLPAVDKKSFQYPGPKPQSKESGIISLADACESTSRTLKKPTMQRIRAMVDGIVEARICDGQLDECGLSLAEIAKVKKSITTTLHSMLHSRVDYPKEKKKSAEEASSDDSQTAQQTETTKEGINTTGQNRSERKPTRGSSQTKQHSAANSGTNSQTP